MASPLLPLVGLLLAPATEVAAAVPVADSVAVPAAVPVLPGDDWNALCLRRAVARWERGDVSGAVRVLASRDTLGVADPRADFLLAWGLRELGDREGFVQAVDALRHRPDGGPWSALARTLARLDAVAGGPAGGRDVALDDPGDDPTDRLLALELLIRDGHAREALSLLDGGSGLSGAVTDALAARAREEAASDPGDDLRRLAGREPATPVDRDLADAARLRLAGQQLAAGRDPGPLLDVGTDGRFASAARHARALAAIDRGDGATARAELEELLRTDPAYDRRREAATALGLLAAREGRWDDSRLALTQAEATWEGTDAALEALAADGTALDGVWDRWSRAGWGASLLLDTEPAERSLAHTAREARSLHAGPELAREPARFVPAARPDLPAGLTPPTAEERIVVATRSAELGAARTDLAGARGGLAAAQRESDLLAAYLDEGLAHIRDEDLTLDAALRRLDAIVARTDEIVARLDAVRDEEQRRILVRTGRFLQDARDNLALARSLQRFRVEGPAATRPEKLPEGIPSPAEILAADQELVSVFVSWIETFAELAPGLVERSHAEIWIPRATTGAIDLQIAAKRQDAWIDDLHVAIGAERTAATDALRFAAAREAVAAAEARVAEAELAVTETRRAIVRGHVEAARAGLAAEHEGLAYALAVATHELAAGTAQDTDDAGRRQDARRLLADARTRYEGFLERHPGSRAASEVRFRLADAMMSVARDDFHDKMARFLGEGGDVTGTDGGRALAPFVDYGPALAIYTELLASDPGFAHRDAVLFHVGMILSDDGDPRATGHLLELVTSYPDSPHAQEAHLRLGDDRFQAKDFSGCLVHYEAAAEGGDPEHAAIALYKAGWAHFNLDGFDASALAFRRLLDVYDAHASAARTTDLRDEGQRHLVEALARAGGAPAFARLFDEHGARPYEPEVLEDLGRMLRRFSLFEEATATDSLWLARWPDSPGSLDAAQRMVKTIERLDDADEARARWLALAPRFRTGSSWWEANAGDSLRASADEFARGAYRAAALHHHRVARDGDDPAEWRSALALYEELLAGWPRDAGTPTHEFYAGEAAAALAEYPRAIAHFGAAAASDTASFRTDAAWQGVAVRDTWYESARTARVAVAGDSATGPDSLATPLIDSIDGFVSAWPADERVPDLLWRKANVAWVHGWRETASDGFAALLRDFPADERALPASRLRARALYELEDFPAAALAYGDALRLAHAAGADSIAAEIEPLVPHCRFREAERIADTYGGDGAESAPLFEEVAERWPDWEHAPTSLYRAGLGYAADGQAADAVRAWTNVAQRWPEGEYARDATLNVAKTWEKENRAGAAALAYERFSETFPEDPDASVALLQAADLFESSGDAAQAERLRTRYLDRFPEDVDTALAILGERAARELASAGPDRPISSLLGVVAAGATAAGAGSSLQRYLDLAGEHADLADRSLLAEVAFREAEEVRAKYDRARITLPLDASIAEKKSLLEKSLQEYQECAQLGIAPWNRAAAARIGECLVGFGDALMESERPADLSGDDLLAYDEVLEEQSWEFYDRGERAWAELIRQASPDGDDDEWTARAKHLLWPRVAVRFVHRPEVEYPLIAATPPPDGGRE